MKYLQTSILICTFALGFALSANAQETQTITIDSRTVTYTETFNDIENATSYYNEEALVMTAYDEDGNGDPDVWLFYREDLSVEKEMHDSNLDGEPDIFFELDANENVIRTSGKGLKSFEPEEVQEVEQLINESETTKTTGDEEVDYAGDLTDIKKLAGESSGWGTWLILLLVAGGVYFWWKKKRKTD